MIEKKDDSVPKTLSVTIGLILIILPLIFNYHLSSKIAQIAVGISLISSALIKNKTITRVISLVAFLVVLFSIFKWGI